MTKGEREQGGGEEGKSFSNCDERRRARLSVDGEAEGRWSSDG